ncbi:MAG TPA: LysR family transcriptional regulator [Ktedonobacterales bacterium]|jgi:DNA-binding transcriptional LysR family regulator
MELRQLLTFQTVVRTGSLLRAAEELQYAQSTITLHIQQLEADLGVKLFARQGKRVQLTEAGRNLRDSADRLLEEATRIQEMMAELVQGETGHIRLGVIEPTASLRLPGLLVPFFTKRPRVRLTLEVGGTQSISYQVATGKLDLGVCSPPPAHLGLHFEPLFNEALVLLAPQTHSLAASETVTPDQLAGQRLLLTEQHCAYREVTERALLSRGTNPYSGIEIGSMEAIKHAVQLGLGVAIVPALVVTPPPAGTVTRKIEQAQLFLSVGFIRRNEPAPVGRVHEVFLAELREHLCERSAG